MPSISQPFYIKSIVFRSRKNRWLTRKENIKWELY
nr:MAG TPA: hypothetical protein [Caudoviricetes sp.]